MSRPRDQILTVNQNLKNYAFRVPAPECELLVCGTFCGWSEQCHNSHKRAQWTRAKRHFQSPPSENPENYHYLKVYTCGNVASHQIATPSSYYSINVLLKISFFLLLIPLFSLVRLSRYCRFWFMERKKTSPGRNPGHLTWHCNIRGSVLGSVLCTNESQKGPKIKNGSKKKKKKGIKVN